MPTAVTRRATRPRSTSSRPTCGPTNSTRRNSADASCCFSTPITFCATSELDQRSAGELDRVVQAAVHQKENRGEERDERYDVEDQRIAHERDGATDLEKFHRLVHFHVVLPIARRATRRRWP